jgi:hypothetical protein
MAKEFHPKEFRPNLQDHPLACLYPLDEDSIPDLAANIVSTGRMNNPIVIMDGQILDGRRRQRALAMALAQGQWVEFSYVTFNPRDHGTNAWSYVVSQNSQRRNAPQGEQLTPILEQELLLNHKKSDRLIASTVRCHNTRVSKMRKKMEDEGRIPRVEERVDSRGFTHDGAALPSAAPGTATPPEAPPPGDQGETPPPLDGQAAPPLELPSDHQAPQNSEVAGPPPTQSPTRQALSQESQEPSTGGASTSGNNGTAGSGAGAGVDAEGNPLPRHMLDVFADTFYDDVLSSLNFFVRHVSNNPDIYVRLMGQPIACPVVEEFKDFARKMAGLLNFHRPHAVCPACGGKEGGCIQCYTTGWISKGQYDEAHPKSNAEVV